MAAADVNWLLSALAQASAALIAIVGGLLVSRYVALHAEQQAARRRVEDLERREHEAVAALTEARHNLDTYYIDDALDDIDVFEEIFERKLQPTVDGVLEVLDEHGRDLDRDLLQQELAAMSADMRTAIQAMVDLVPQTEDHDNWTTFRRTHSLEVGHRNLWEWVYDKVCEERRTQARKAAREARNSGPLAGLLGQMDYLPIIPQIIDPQISASYRMINSQRELARVGALEVRIAEADAEVRALSQELRLAEETYQATRQPEGFFLALQVLTVLAVVGMGVPVVAMGFAPLTLPGCVRAVVIGLFFVGVALLLRFLFVYAAFLREGGRETLPHTALGLFGRRRRRPSDESATGGSLSEDLPG